MDWFAKQWFQKTQAMSTWHLRLYRQGEINILYSCRSSLFCNSQHNKPKKSAPLQRIFLLPWISRTWKKMLHLRQWHHIKHSPHFFREFMTFGEARMMTTTGNRHSSEAAWKTTLSPLKWMLSKSSPVKCAASVNSTPLALGSELAPCFVLSPVFCLYLYLSLTVPGSEVAFPCPKLFFSDSNWWRNTCSSPKVLFNSEQANNSAQKDLLPIPWL